MLMPIRKLLRASYECLLVAALLNSAAAAALCGGFVPAKAVAGVGVLSILIIAAVFRARTIEYDAAVTTIELAPVLNPFGKNAVYVDRCVRALGNTEARRHVLQCAMGAALRPAPVTEDYAWELAKLSRVESLRGMDWLKAQVTPAEFPIL